MSKKESYRDMAIDEMRKKINEMNHELFNLRFQLATHQLENPMRIRTVRRSIARMLTVIREKEIAA